MRSGRGARPAGPRRCSPEIAGRLRLEERRGGRQRAWAGRPNTRYRVRNHLSGDSRAMTGVLARKDLYSELAPTTASRDRAWTRTAGPRSKASHRRQHRRAGLPDPRHLVSQYLPRHRGPPPATACPAEARARLLLLRAGFAVCS
jgi:hypothetical protein